MALEPYSSSHYCDYPYVAILTVSLNTYIHTYTNLYMYIDTCIFGVMVASKYSQGSHGFHAPWQVDFFELLLVRLKQAGTEGFRV